jgi:hypothetical protein
MGCLSKLSDIVLPVNAGFLKDCLNVQIIKCLKVCSIRTTTCNTFLLMREVDEKSQRSDIKKLISGYQLVMADSVSGAS